LTSTGVKPGKLNTHLHCTLGGTSPFVEDEVTLVELELEEAELELKIKLEGELTWLLIELFDTADELEGEVAELEVLGRLDTVEDGELLTWDEELATGTALEMADKVELEVETKAELDGMVEELLILLGEDTLDELDFEVELIGIIVLEILVLDCGADDELEGEVAELEVSEEELIAESILEETIEEPEEGLDIDEDNVEFADDEEIALEDINELTKELDNGDEATEELEIPLGVASKNTLSGLLQGTLNSTLIAKKLYATLQLRPLPFVRVWALVVGVIAKLMNDKDTAARAARDKNLFFVKLCIIIYNIKIL
jgi:hypothetical protein